MLNHQQLLDGINFTYTHMWSSTAQFINSSSKKCSSSSLIMSDQLFFLEFCCIQLFYVVIHVYASLMLPRIVRYSKSVNGNVELYLKIV